MVFTILSVTAAWKALAKADMANSWAYYSYEAALAGIRLALMSLCADPVYINTSTCMNITSWEYLPWVLNTYYPPSPNPGPVPQIHNIVTHNITPASAVSAAFGCVIGAFVSLTVLLFFSGALDDENRH